MPLELVGLIGFLLFLILMGLGVPIGGAMAFVGLVGYAATVGIDPTVKFLGLMSYYSISKYDLSVIPLFVLMGHLAYHANIAADVFDVGKKWLGHIPGGLVHATIVAEAAFGAASGSMMATCAVMTKVTIPEMTKAGVDKKLAYGAVVASSTVDGLIPPSIAMVIYGLLTETSIGKLLVAGILPGILVVVLFMVMVYTRVKLNPSLAPINRTHVSWKERLISLRKLGPFSFIVVVIIGGLYLGLFTPTEAGAVGACGMLIIGLILNRLNLKNIKQCLRETIGTSVSIFFILIGAFMFSYFLGICRMPQTISGFLLSLDAGPTITMILVMIFYTLTGAFMDEIAAFFITLPMIWPVLKALGIDPIWCGVLLCVVQAVGLITPPYGLNLFIVKSIFPEITIQDIVEGAGWFLAMNAVALVILMIFPQISLFLVSQMK